MEDPVWLLMSLFTIIEALVVFALVMPMPSNQVRGSITQAISQAWHKSEYVRKSSWVVLTLNSFYLYDSLRNLLSTSSIVASATCDARATAMLLQRNAYICGFSIFLFFVMRRLLEIQGQLFETRTLVKQAALGEANGTAERGGSMRALDRAVSKVVSDDVDSAVLASLKQE